MLLRSILGERDRAGAHENCEVTVRSSILSSRVSSRDGHEALFFISLGDGRLGPPGGQ